MLVVPEAEEVSEDGDEMTTFLPEEALEAVPEVDLVAVEEGAVVVGEDAKRLYPRMTWTKNSTTM